MTDRRAALLALLLVPVLASVPVLVPIPLAAAAPAALGNGKITVTADNFVVDEAKSMATFSGSVYVVHPKVKVWADTVVALYGAGGASDIKSFTATGHVKLVTPSQTATGERAVFDPKTQILTLTGSVFNWPRQTLVTSGKVHFDLSSGATLDAAKMTYDAKLRLWGFTSATLVVPNASGSGETP